jgi:hypothetical protein
MNWQFYLLIFGALFAFIVVMLLIRHWMHALQVSNLKNQRMEDDAKTTSESNSGL